MPQQMQDVMKKKKCMGGMNGTPKIPFWRPRSTPRNSLGYGGLPSTIVQ